MDDDFKKVNEYITEIFPNEPRKQMVMVTLLSLWGSIVGKGVLQTVKNINLKGE